MHRYLTLACAPLMLAGCAANTTEDDVQLPVREADASCDGSAVQYHIGHTASAEMGQAMLAESGARTLRWAPPRSAMTMDYRHDRLTVSYDDNMVIDRVSCG